MSNVSYWSDFTPPHFSKAASPAHFDVVIVGGGITGLTAAYLLKQAGRKVCVLEKETIGSGETSHTSAHLTYVTDLRLSELAKHFGEQNAALVWHGGEAAIDLIESVSRSNSIDCDFSRVPGFLYATPSDDRDEREDLQREQQLVKRLGFPAQFLEKGPIASEPAILYPNQAIVHPLKYLAGLAKLVDGDGSRVFESSEVEKFESEPLSVTANSQRITCDDIVIATHVPLTGVEGLLGAMLMQTKLYPYSSYVLHATLPSAAIEPGLYSDTADPYYYLRVHMQDGVRHAVFGGQDHKTGQSSDTEARFLQLESYFVELFGDAHVSHRWSGQVIETDDGLPFTGQAADHQYIATGYAGNGLTFGTLSAMIIRDAILGHPNALSDLFDPNRKKMSGITTFISENIDYPRYLIADYLKPHDSDPASVKRGEGAVLSIDGKRVAVHRKNDDSLLAVSAVCTHLGCLVRWNQSEETWDCPCHGSRFAPDGSVIGGPAEEPLATVNVPQDKKHEI